MTFKVVETYWDIQNDGYYLVHSNWDDWFKYETTYLFYIKKNNQTTNVGSIKIGQFSMVEGQRVPNLPEEFDSLSPQYTSNNRKEMGTSFTKLNPSGKLGI
ncbi:TPA: hypothetical protein VJX18_001571 [Streptococcus pyogenes]|nr:hypothetical protein [Streptococcus pyogenes]